MKKPLILVIGATGTVGSEVVKLLVEGSQKVRALVRDPAKATKFSNAVEIIKGDLAKSETLSASFAGVDKAFVLCPPVADLEQLEANAFEAAKQAGVQHVVKLSGVGVDSFASGTPSGQWHGASEERLRELGVAWTILRPGRFMSSTPFSWSSVKEHGEMIEPTGYGKQALIDPRDIAAVAVKVLTTSGHDGKIYELTGPEALSGAEIAEKIGQVIGKSVKFIDATPEAAREAMLKSGFPAQIIDLVLKYCPKAKAGHCARVTTSFTELLGRPARSYEEWLNDYAAALT